MSKTRKRRQYRGSRRFDKSCRNHGGCAYCRGNRLHASTVQAAKVEPERSGLDTRTQDINMTQEPVERCLHPERSPLEFTCVDCQRNCPTGSGEWNDGEGKPFMCKQCCDRHDKEYAEEQSCKARRRLAVRLIRRGTNLKRRDIPNALVDLKVAQLNLKKLICQHHKTSKS